MGLSAQTAFLLVIAKWNGGIVLPAAQIYCCLHLIWEI